MSSMVGRAPRLRAGAEKTLPENSFQSPSSSSRHQTPPISPEGVKYRHAGKHRPQISIEQADLDASSATNSDHDSGSMQGSHYNSVGDITDTSHNSLQQNTAHQNGHSSSNRNIHSHLQVRPRPKKSNTLPNDLSYIGGSDNFASEASSVCNSSEAECDSDESSVVRDPRDLLQNEQYWQSNCVGIMPLLADKIRRQDSQGGLQGNDFVVSKEEEEVEEDEEGAEDGYDEMDEYMSNSEGSGDEHSGSTAPSFPQESGTKDDEVFPSDFCSGLDQVYEADTKLVDWSYNVFVPACRTLLLHCKDGDSSELSSGQVLADMRSLSSTISFFCSEQQRLGSSGGHVGVGGAGGGGGGGAGGMSTSLGGHRRQGISASISTDRISRIRDYGKSIDKGRMDDGLDLNIKTASMMSSDSNSSSGFESQDNSYDRSYSVKILRSVSQSLIAPLIQEAEDGFTPELYKSIVQAVQKIAWKVEACLAINNPSKETEVYMKIFDQEQQENLTEKMINALPPEEPKLVTAATGLSSRSNSLSLVMKRTTSNGRTSLGLELGKKAEEAGSPCTPKMSPSAVPGRNVSGEGEVRNSTISTDLTTSISSETTFNSSFLDSRSTSISEEFRRSGFSGVEFGEMSRAAAVAVGSDIQAVRRDRVATFASPSRNSKAWHSFDEHERDAKCRLSSENLECSTANEPHYFRPKHVRRTTVSLSRKEVSKLGWKVAKKAEKSSSALSSTRSRGMNGSGECTGSTRRRAIHKSGNISLPELKEYNASSIRTKSASTSNLLDDGTLKSSDDKSGKNATAAGTGGIPKLRRSRNRSYDDNIQCSSTDDKDLSVTLKHQSSVESASLSEHLAKSYKPVCKQTSMPGISSSIEDGWTMISPDHAASLNSSSRLRSGSRNSKVMAVKTLSRKAKKVVAQKSLSASEKFTNKVIKTAIALRRGSISTFVKGRKEDVFSVSSSMDELHEEAVGGAVVGGAAVGSDGASVGGEGSQTLPTGRPPRPSSTSEPPSPHSAKKKSGTMPNKRGTLSRLSNKAKTKSFGSTQSLPRRSKKGSQKTGFVSNAQVAPADQAALTESIYKLSKNAVQPSLEESKLSDILTCV